MPFRKIRPSFGKSSASPKNPGQSTYALMGSGEKSEESSNTASKRRRVPESVTRNACIGCRKARAKCDGNSPCKRCSSRQEASECVYEVHIKHAKEELLKQIKGLRAKNHVAEQILQALSAEEKVPEILERLKDGDRYEDIVQILGTPIVDDLDPLSPRDSQTSTFEPSDHEMGGTNAPFYWTTVTSDKAILDHLFQLYFAWVHPVHTLFSERHFVDSYRRHVDSFCSSILVNAICAMACHFHSASEEDEVNFEQLGQEFSDNARSSLDTNNKRITTAQSLALIFLVDCCHSNVLRGEAYLKAATKTFSEVLWSESEGFHEVWTTTLCGIRNLTTEWAQITFQAPPIIDPQPFIGVEVAHNSLDLAKWYFYRSVNDQCPAWPSLLATTNREKNRLTAIIFDSATMLYSPQAARLSAKDILQVYGRLVAWRGGLPPSIIDVESKDSRVLPHALSLLILYSNTVIQLLRPLLDFEGFPSAMVEEIIWKTAQEGLFLLGKHYQTQYTCRYQPVLQLFGVLHLADVVARFFPNAVDDASKDGSAAIQFAMEVLLQSSPAFAIAGPLYAMLKRTADECSIVLPRSFLESSGLHQQKETYRMDEFIDACTRPTYVQPVAEIHKRYLSSLSFEWATDSLAYGFCDPPVGSRRLRDASARERGAQSHMQIRNLLNTG